MGFGDEIPKRVWSLLLPPPVAESGRRRLETARSAMRDYAGFPGRQPNVPLVFRRNRHDAGCITDHVMQVPVL